MVTDALDNPIDRHIDRIVGEILTSRQFDTAAIRLLAAADLGGVLERGAT